MEVFKGKSSNEVWIKAGKKILNLKKLTDSRLGDTREILHAGISITNPLDRWVTSRKPFINPAFALAEVIWIVNGRSNANFINFWNSSLPKFSGYVKNYHGAYGNRLRNFHNVDQLDIAYEILKKNSKSRQVVLQIWNASKDLPYRNGKPKSKDIPCNVSALLKIRDKKLEWMQILRSNDIFLGVPYNLIQFTYLQEVLSGWLGLDIGNYNQLSDSLHLYNKDYDNMKNSIEHNNPKFKKNKEFESIALPKKYSLKYFLELELICNKLIYNIDKPNELENLNRWNNSVQPFRNILYVLTSEFARRQGWNDLSEDIMSKCTNNIFIYLWNNWKLRVRSNNLKNSSP